MSEEAVIRKSTSNPHIRTDSSDEKSLQNKDSDIGTSNKPVPSFLTRKFESNSKENRQNASESNANEFIEELTKLFKIEGSRTSISEPLAPSQNEIAQEDDIDSKPEHDTSTDHIYDRIRAIRLQAVKPELTIQFATDKLSALDQLNEEFDGKREKIKATVSELKQKLDDSFKELNQKLEVKFLELRENAEQLLKAKTEEIDEMQKVTKSRATQIKRVKDLLAQTFDNSNTNTSKYELNLTKLQEKKSEIHYFIHGEDPFDITLASKQCAVKSFLKPQSVSEFIDKLHLIELEIRALRGLEDISPPSAKEQRLFEQFNRDRKFRNYPETDVTMDDPKMSVPPRQFSSSTQVQDLIDEIKSPKESLLSMNKSQDSPDINRYESNLRKSLFKDEKLSLVYNLRKENAGKAYLYNSGSDSNLLSPRNQQPASMHSTTKENSSSYDRLNAISNPETLNVVLPQTSALSGSLNSLRKQRELFTKSSLRNGK